MQNAECRMQNVGRLRLVPLTLYNNTGTELCTELRAVSLFKNARAVSPCGKLHIIGSGLLPCGQ